MRGFPPIHLMLLAIAFALVAVPLVQLTGRSAREEGLAAETKLQSGEGDLGASGEEKTPVQIRLRFAHRPERVSLMVGERELLEGLSWSELQAVVETQLVIGEDGDELWVSASWPSGTPDTALTVELEPDGLEQKSETRWSEAGELSEVLTFHWKS